MFNISKLNRRDDGSFDINFKIKNLIVLSERGYAFQMKNKQIIGNVTVLYFIESGYLKIRYKFLKDDINIFLQILNQNLNFDVPKKDITLYVDSNEFDVIKDINSYRYDNKNVLTIQSTDPTLHENMWDIMYIYDNNEKKSNIQEMYYLNSYGMVLNNFNQKKHDEKLANISLLNDTLWWKFVN